MSAAPNISIIIPVINEADNLARCLPGLKSSLCELIVVDGGSSDQSCEVASAYVDHVVRSEPSRAKQMNAGAAIAGRKWLIFLHADTQLPCDFVSLVEQVEAGWGRFDMRLSGEHWLLRLVEFGMNCRSRFSGVATGDQAIFVERDLFHRMAGFADIPLMEDVDWSNRAKYVSRPICLKAKVISSSRKWERHGIIKTITMMWWFRWLYFWGISADDLALRYYPDRKVWLKSKDTK